MPKTRILYASDVHGSERCFRKFINAAKHNVYKANVLLLSGDLTGKAIIPIVEEISGKYTAYSEKALGERRLADSVDEVESLKKMLSARGFYPIILRESEYDALRTNQEEVKKLFHEEMLNRLAHWVEVAERDLSSMPVKCFIMPGNDDPVEASEVIGKSGYVVDPEGKCILVDDRHEMISLGFSNPTPWNTPRELSEENLIRLIEEMASKVQDMKSCIFNFHCPPYASKIDEAPLLDGNLRPTASLGDVLRGPVGSKAIRDAVEKYQPMLGVHGHIHESAGAVNIGKTVCLNPGSEYQTGILRAFIIDIDEKGVRSYLRVEG